MSARQTLKSFFIVVILLLGLAAALQAQQIFDAVKADDLANVKELVGKDASLVNLKNQNGNTPLHIAARQGNVDIAAFLIEKGADLEAKNPTGYTPLFFAVLSKQPEAVRFFLGKGADVNAQTRFQTTPLFTAAESGNSEIVRALIEKGANVNHISPWFGTPLHRAAYMSFPEVAKILLDAGADLKAADQHGRSALHQAAQLGRVEIARLLIERGADLDAVDSWNQTALHWAIRAGTDRLGVNNAAELGFLLMAKGAQVDLADKDGMTPLIWAVRQGYTDLAGAIISRGADIAIREPGTDRTLLHLAALKGYGDIAELLLSRGLDAAAKDANGMTALDYAREHGNPTVALRVLPPGAEMGEMESGDRFLSKKLRGGEALIWMLNRRGWAVKTKSHLFVFDNEELGRKPDWPSLANGWISAPEISGQDIIALYSGYHALPNTMEFIHGLENVLPRITYINYKEDAWRGGTKTRYVKGREVQQVGGAEITPYETVDAGGMGSLGYLIKVDGQVIFYPNFFPEDIEAFKTEIDFLAARAKTCDVALIEVTPGQENIYAAYIVEKLKPKVVIPYDRSGNAENQRQLAEELGRRYPNLEFGLFRDAGDRLHYRRGIVDRRP